MKKISTIVVLFSIVAVAGSDSFSAAVIPEVDGYTSLTGFTRIDFCHNDGKLYAFNGLDLYRYDADSENFNVAFSGLGSITSKMWDPADFAFVTDQNDIVLPTGLSQGFVWADVDMQFAEEKTNLARNYYSIASRYRAQHVFANGVGQSVNTIFLIETEGDGNEIEVAQVSNRNSGAVTFDAADNLYLADFHPFGDGSGLGEVDIFRISRGQLDEFVIDANFIVLPELLVNDVNLAGSDSLVIDANYCIYVGSNVGIAKITPSPDPNLFVVEEIDGDIYANPHSSWPPPAFVFSGITADIQTGTMYYGKSEWDETEYIYGPYYLHNVSIEPVTQWPADLDGDGIVDESDLWIFVGDYCFGGEYLAGDLNNDNWVNLKDFTVLAGQWSETASWYRETY
jgi:hypothetical protein